MDNYKAAYAHLSARVRQNIDLLYAGGEEEQRSEGSAKRQIVYTILILEEALLESEKKITTE